MKPVDVFGKSLIPLKNKRLFLLDQDGTIYKENHLFPGAIPFWQGLKDHGITAIFITNNSSKNTTDYARKLRGLGLDVTEENFYTSVDATIHYLKTKYPKCSVYPVGTSSFIKALKAEDVPLDTADKADIALLSYDTELTYEKLMTLSEMLTKREVIYLATNPDWVCPTAFGYAPDCGSFAFMIEKATGKYPVFIGKPSPLMIEVVLEKTGFKKEEVVVIGDRVYTDIASAYHAGVDSIAVLSGEVTLDEIKKSEIIPTYVINDIGDLVPLFR